MERHVKAHKSTSVDSIEKREKRARRLRSNEGKKTLVEDCSYFQTPFIESKIILGKLPNFLCYMGCVNRLIDGGRS